MPETRVTLIGRLAADPELRFTPSGAAVANFTIATSTRLFDKTAGEWTDGPTSFHRCSAWRDLAEHIAESLHKGTAVIASGTLAQREYETKGGEKRQAWDVTVDAIGPDLRWHTATVAKAERATSVASSDPWASPQQGQEASAVRPGTTQSPSGYSWGSTPPSAPQGVYPKTQGGGWDEPPF